MDIKDINKDLVLRYPDKIKSFIKRVVANDDLLSEEMLARDSVVAWVKGLSIRCDRRDDAQSAIRTNKITLRLADESLPRELAPAIADAMVSRLVADAERFKEIAKKVIDAWDRTPEKFKPLDRPRVFMRQGLLTGSAGHYVEDGEYNHDLRTSFGNINGKHVFVSYYGMGFYTGCGFNTYHDREYHVDVMNGVDGWVKGAIKEIRSKKTADKIVHCFMNTDIKVPLDKIDEVIEVVTNFTEDLEYVGPDGLYHYLGNYDIKDAIAKWPLEEPVERIISACHRHSYEIKHKDTIPVSVCKKCGRVK